ncbi:hypothetical protein X777_06512 [Ooceraea biroi]|uniref:Uncharacterized protein n=1 Tax=Ooceraea biroi TaxID=2015173 RepID=A0A026WCM9_OOCBI|nr:hypothetical protein X777_06512 [Ooceraea biroi]
MSLSAADSGFRSVPSGNLDRLDTRHKHHEHVRPEMQRISGVIGRETKLKGENERVAEEERI